jgi:hypothetical protein
MDIYDQQQGGDSQTCSHASTTSTTSTTTPPCPALPPPPLSPLLSVNQLLALYSRERLLVHPLCWTDRQPALLGCHINSRYDETRNSTVEENAGVVSSKSDPDDGHLAKRLKSQLDQERLADVVEQLLEPLNARRILFQMEYVSLCRPNLGTHLHTLTSFR